MAEPQPFNILYIHSHDTGRYIQPYGHAIPTPNLQRLAEEGVLFRRAFLCCAHLLRAVRPLLTGRVLTQLHARPAHRGFSLYDYGRHIVHTFAAGRLRTVLAACSSERGNAAQIAMTVIGRANAEELAIEWLEAGPPNVFP